MNTDYPESGQAVTALVLGLVSLMFPPLGPFAWYVGSKEIRAIDDGRRPPADRGLALAGKVLGIITTALMIVVVAVIVLAIALVIAFR